MTDTLTELLVRFETALASSSIVQPLTTCLRKRARLIFLFIEPWQDN